MGRRIYAPGGRKKLRACCVLSVAALLAVAGCHALPHMLWPEPDPDDYYHYSKGLKIHAKTINQEKDTMGIRIARFPIYRYSYHRPSVEPYEENTYFGYDFSETLYIDVATPDTNFRSYSASVYHFIGYQRERGGDTNRLASLDSLPGWEFDLGTAHEDVILENGQSLFRFGGLPSDVPDTVPNDSEIEIEMIFDMDGLFRFTYPSPGDTGIRVDQTKITYRQR